MTTNIDLKVLANEIEKNFVEQDKYVFEKKVTEFKVEDAFVGDIINFLMFDGSTNPPTFYEVSTPFDLVSKKAPQHALVFRDGKCTFQTDYTDYAAMRTGLMDALTLIHTQGSRYYPEMNHIANHEKPLCFSLAPLHTLQNIYAPPLLADYDTYIRSLGH